MHRRDAIRLLGLGTLGLGLGFSRSGFAAPALKRSPNINWQAIEAYIEKARLDWRAPGLGVAIVQNGETIFAKGFGVRNVDTNAPVNADTMFNVGSTTKAFTSAGVAMMVDQKKLDWDTPVREYLPSFRMGNGNEYDSVNLRDMLSHRTGLGRHDLIWYNNKNLTRAELLARLPYLDTFAPLRSKYQYNNHMFILGGYALETVAGISWEEYTKSKIFSPLGMKRSNTSFEEMMLDNNYANGHRLRDKTVQYSIPIRVEDKIGPAGAINSSVNDYAKWIALQLGRGTHKDTRLFSRAQSDIMWEPLVGSGGVPSSPELSRGFYGLGWRIDTYRGMTRVAHGGNLNGFASRVTLIPEKNLGIVAFTNLGASPLPGHVSLDVIDMILGLEPANWSARNLARRNAAETATPSAATGPRHVANTKPSREISEFVGRYNHKGYGDLNISIKEGGLWGSYNDMPIELEHWHYDVFNANPVRGEDADLKDIKFVFASNEEGKISGFSAKMEESTPPVIFAKMT